MATVRDRLITEMKLEGATQYGQQLVRTAETTKKLADETERVQKRQSDLVGTFRRAIGTYITFQAVVKSYNAIIRETEDTQRRAFEVTHAFANLGRREFIPVLNEMAQSLSELTAIDDDLILTTGKLLAQFGLTNEQIKRALPVLADFSRANNLDIIQSTEMAERAILGQARTLKLYVGQLKLGTDQAKNFETVMRAMARSAVGMGAAFRGTLPGSREAVEVSRGNLYAAIGKKFEPSVIAGRERVTGAQIGLQKRIESGQLDWVFRMIDLQHALNQIADTLSGEKARQLATDLRRRAAGLEPLYGETGLIARRKAAEAAAKTEGGFGQKDSKNLQRTADSLEKQADALIQNVLGGAGEAARRALNIRAARQAFRNRG